MDILQLNSSFNGAAATRAFLTTLSAVGINLGLPVYDGEDGLDGFLCFTNVRETNLQTVTGK